MIGMRKPKYQTCKKCHHQSEIPQETDCLIGIWGECPKCGSSEWILEDKGIFEKAIGTILNIFK